MNPSRELTEGEGVKREIAVMAAIAAVSSASAVTGFKVGNIIEQAADNDSVLARSVEQAIVENEVEYSTSGERISHEAQEKCVRFAMDIGCNILKNVFGSDR